VKVVTLKMSEDVYYLLKEYANRHNMTVSEVIRRALIKYLKEENPETRNQDYYGKYIKISLGKKIAAE